MSVDASDPILWAHPVADAVRHAGEAATSPRWEGIHAFIVAAPVKATGLTAATVNKSLAHLERAGVVGELTSRRRGRVFAYLRYVHELSAGLPEPA